MKKIIILVVLNLVLFAVLRMMSVLVFFLFGIGASASSEKYIPYILLIPLITQLLVVFLLFWKKRYIKTNTEIIISIILIVILYSLGQMELIPF
jgi:hypothetical protein